jgi:diketogulonate reductase-like aldo/keto reductase
VIGQGTWYIDRDDRASAIAALRRGLDLGMNYIDTAEMYGAGAAELMVGEAIAGQRDEVFLVTKALPEHASEQGTRIACERSLLRLKTDGLDCSLLHWRGPHPLEDTFAAFEGLRDEGKILSYGVSNFDVPDLEDAVEIAGEGTIACNQVLYQLQERAIEHTVLPWCEQHGLAVTAYSPLGHGEFPSKLTPGGRVLAEIAEAHHATCGCRKSSPDILVVQSAQDRTAKNVSGPLHDGGTGASFSMDRCVCMTAARDEDAARRTRQRGQGIPVGSNRSTVQHVHFAMGSAATSVDRECRLIAVFG